ncbi:putative RNA-directed DNA polymerase from transposon BS [Caerostris extrusa]|uniref:RNA-directed DNA polymerase from transposon BS n=1 Tax=Caerostris extrusa TaxID=172846 RepID=A0AAV4SF94_CAEEX|nr:putative RNA-directed DNA polymerase from transposon BS [Caerostris extrusa]
MGFARDIVQSTKFPDFVQRVRDAHNMKPSRHTMAVFLDLTRLLTKFGKISYWGNAFQRLISRAESHRGSVLRLTLFSLYLTGIERVVSPYQIGIFADDIIVWDHNSDLTKLENTLNDTLKKIQHFANEHKLAFNTTKSIRSSNLLSNWTNNQRLKKDSPLGLIWKQGLADIEVEPSVPFNLLTPTTVLSNVTFKDLKVKFIKHEEHPELLRQLALEIINNISPRALVIYTDGSKSDSGRTGSGIFMKTSTGEFRYRFRNPDHSSVFRSELTAISEALSLALDF